MSCHYCRHEFCFVCLQPWTSGGFHEDKGCPPYGDPVEGYDREGYERGGRGLHRDTGYNRAGFDRLGQQQLSHAVVEGNLANEHDAYSDNENPDLDEYGWGDESDSDVEFDDDGWNGDDEQADANWSEDELGLDQADLAQIPNRSDGEAEAEQDDQANDQAELTSVEANSAIAATGSEVGATQSEAVFAASTDEAVEATTETLSDLAPEPQQRPRSSRPSNLVRQQIRLVQRVPILASNPHPDNRVFIGGTPSFQQLECSHSWHQRVLYQTDYGYAHCRGCSYTANSWTNYCSTCGVVACDWCTCSFRTRFVARWEHATTLLDILDWAEQGVVPFKAERRRVSEQLKDEMWADCGGDWLGLATMMETYEAQLYGQQPFLYWDFGIQLMFEELELEMRKKYCAVTEEDVGISGLTLTFDLATNPFAPLYWDK